MTPLSTPESATGLGFIGRVRLFERPHTNENYLTREMGFRVARKHAAKLVRIAFVLAARRADRPAAGGDRGRDGDAGACRGAGRVTLPCFTCCGMLVERWLFFAEAKHAVMKFYQVPLAGDAQRQTTSLRHRGCCFSRRRSSAILRITRRMAALLRFAARRGARCPKASTALLMVSRSGLTSRSSQSSLP